MTKLHIIVEKTYSKADLDLDKSHKNKCNISVIIQYLSTPVTVHMNNQAVSKCLWPFANVLCYLQTS